MASNFLAVPGRLNGFGHVQFDTEEAVQRAIKLHGADLLGRELFVDAASNRPPEAALGTGKPVEGCWFCLSNPTADVNLIASIGADAAPYLYVAFSPTASRVLLIKDGVTC